MTFAPANTAISWSPTERYLFLEALREYGGHFYRGLAVPLERADPVNFRRLVAAFPELPGEFGPGGRFYAGTQAYREKAEQLHLDRTQP